MHGPITSTHDHTPGQFRHLTATSDSVEHARAAQRRTSCNYRSALLSLCGCCCRLCCSQIEEQLEIWNQVILDGFDEEITAEEIADNVRGLCGCALCTRKQSLSATCGPAVSCRTEGQAGLGPGRARQGSTNHVGTPSATPSSVCCVLPAARGPLHQGRHANATHVR